MLLDKSSPVDYNSCQVDMSVLDFFITAYSVHLTECFYSLVTIEMCHVGRL